VIHAFQGKQPTIHETAFVEETAQIIGDVEIGAHSSVWFHTVIRGDVNRIRIGHHTNIQDGTVIHPNRVDPHGVEIGDFVTLGHAVRLHGARVGSHCLIAIGAIVLDGVVMEDESIVAAGALVPPGTRIPRRTLMLGNPARPHRTLSDADLELIRRPTRSYVQLKDLYRGES
jgi:carbonic anhydrase/acetyltransferase-like protein (isoleucine patch superfamily)